MTLQSESNAPDSLNSCVLLRPLGTAWVKCAFPVQGESGEHDVWHRVEHRQNDPVTGQHRAEQRLTRMHLTTQREFAS